MKHLLFAAALAAAVPVAAQVVTPDQTADIASASDAMRALAKKLTPAAVDPKPVAALTDRLSKDGTQLQMEEGEIGNLLARRAAPDARGRFRSVEANLVELPAEAVEAKSESMIRDLVMRRYFSRLEATSDDWTVDPQTGVGRVDEWHYVVSLDGKLLSVEHTVVPVEPVAPGDAEPVEAKGRSYRLSPSDPSVQRRWKKFSKELLTLGKTVEV
jgi:hypothetical protein